MTRFFLIKLLLGVALMGPQPMASGFQSAECVELARAVEDEDVNAVEHLLAQGVPASSIDSLRLVHRAALLGNAEILALLAYHGAHIGLWDGQGLSPLELAVGAGRAHVVATLIVLGADLFDGEHEGGQVLAIAHAMRRPQILGLLHAARWFQSDRLGDWNALDPHGWTFAHHLAYGGYVTAMRALIDQGFDVTIPSGRSWPDGPEYRLTPLHYAAGEGYWNIAHLLLESGGRVDDRDAYGWTPLHYAAYRGRLDVILALVRRGADVNAINDMHQTALHFAVMLGHDSIAEQLLIFGADRMMVTRSGYTAHDFAVYFSRNRILPRLDGRRYIRVQRLGASDLEQQVQNQIAVDRVEVDAEGEAHIGLRVPAWSVPRCGR